MPRFYLLILTCLLCLPTALAQDGLVTALTTDKDTYEYGEVIELRYTITNESDEELAIYGSSNCHVGFAWDELVHPGEGGGCYADHRAFPFAPGSARTWVWRLFPAWLAKPSTDGQQTIYAGNRLMHSISTLDTALLVDSTSFYAPRYLGGVLSIGLTDGLTVDDVGDIMDSLNAYVYHIFDFPNSYSILTRIEGIRPEDAMDIYLDDERIRWMQIRRSISYSDMQYIVSIEPDGDSAPPGLSVPYPNPSRGAITLTLTPPQAGPARVELFDLHGRRVALLHHGDLAGGHPVTLTLHAPRLAAGPYVLRATGPDYSFAQLLTIVE